MELIREYVREAGQGGLAGWNRFWFTPADPATLGLIRVMAGAMLLYTHLVWTLGLADFFGAESWTSPHAASLALADSGTYAWSYFWLIQSPALLCAAHIAALVVFALLMLGLFSRVVSILAYLAAVSYVNRVPGALFGLDQINCMLAMYLMIGPSGAAYSLDRLRLPRAADGPRPPAAPSTSANLAVRLMQVHMCVIYFFAAMGKLRGDSWWSGDAMWLSVANLEYQSWDVTWLARWPLLSAIATQVTVYWELFFCVLVWPRLTRPLMLVLAVPVHLGIAVCMGMITFGLIMLVGCVSFVPPWLVRWCLERGGHKRAGEGLGARVAQVSTRRSRPSVAGGRRGS
ncbi:MAG TPA: HTTM domain-containing protein [Pirellulales bacterium]|nr:HTTM domain-containing protein [Pirellulales bacterium]